MYRYMLTLFLCAPSILVASQAAVQMEPLTRERAHSGRRLSSFTGNQDYGVQVSQELSAHLLELAKKDVNRKFFAAAQSGTGLEEFLAINDFDFNVKNEEDRGKTALMYVAKLGRSDLIEKLLNRGALPFSIRDDEGLCAYNHAEGHLDARKLMHTSSPEDIKKRHSLETKERAEKERRSSINRIMGDVCTVLYMSPTEQKEK